jgi:hypothetical protein
MALLKKDKSPKPDAAGPEPQLEKAPVDTEEQPLTDVDVSAPAAEPAAPLAVVEVPAAPDPPAQAGDDLLNMFEAVGIHQEDRSLLLGMAGDIDITDLVSELNIVAAALGIVMAERNDASAEDVELPAAA